MGKTPKTKADHLEAREQLVERRAIIKNVINDRGWQKMVDLHNILTTEYNYKDGSPIDITRQTLYNDLDVIGRELDVPGRATSNLIAAYQQKVSEIDKMLSKCRDTKEKIQLYKLWTQYSKDYAIVLGRINSSNSADALGGKSQKANITFQFDDVE